MKMKNYHCSVEKVQNGYVVCIDSAYQGTAKIFFQLNEALEYVRSYLSKESEELDV